MDSRSKALFTEQKPFYVKAKVDCFESDKDGISSGSFELQHENF